MRKTFYLFLFFYIAASSIVRGNVLTVPFSGGDSLATNIDAALGGSTMSLYSVIRIQCATNQDSLKWQDWEDLRVWGSKTTSTLAVDLTSVPLNAIPDSAFIYQNWLTDVYVSDNVVSIGDYAFYDCVRLKMNPLFPNVRRIGDSAFGGCSDLELNQLPGNLEYIGDYAFSYIHKLTQITIPASVKTIGKRVFTGTKLETVIFKGCPTVNVDPMNESFQGIPSTALFLYTGATSPTLYNRKPIRVAEPVIYNLSEDIQVDEGLPVEMSFNFNPLGHLSYRWQKNNALIDGATSSVYSLDSAKLGDNGDYRMNYFVDGESYFTRNIVLNVRPVFKSITLNGVEIEDFDPYTYTYYINVPYDTSVVTIEGIPMSPGLTVCNKIDNRAISLRETNFKLEVSYNDVKKGLQRHTYNITVNRECENVEIVKNLVIAPACQGTDHLISMKARGTNLSYHWFHKDNEIYNADGDSVLIKSVRPEDEGYYKVIVQGACGNAKTDSALLLSYNTPTVIMNSLEDTLVCPGDSHQYMIQAKGDLLSYQWYMEDEPIVGATQNSYLVSNASEDDYGRYKVLVSGACGAKESNASRLWIVWPLPDTIEIDVPDTVYVGQMYRVSVSDENLADVFDYSWSYSNQHVNFAHTSGSIRWVNFVTFTAPARSATLSVEIGHHCESRTVSKEITVLEKATSIEGIKKYSGITVYPNPVENEDIHVISDKYPLEKVEVRDMYGRIVYSWKMPLSGMRDLTLPSSQWQKGVFVISIEANKETENFKIIHK